MFQAFLTEEALYTFFNEKDSKNHFQIENLAFGILGALNSLYVYHILNINDAKQLVLCTILGTVFHLLCIFSCILSTAYYSEPRRG